MSPYGAVPNSFRPEYICGGSSSGSAYVVATGQADFALGTDTAGSGRVPAGFNNIVGLKPSRGLVSAHGVVPAAQSVDCVSIFAGTVGLAARVLARDPAGVLAKLEKISVGKKTKSKGDRGQRVKALQIAMESTKLENGLNVLVAPDTTAPVVTVGVYYKIGFRLEPQGRSGFAHLFEHMMFQGSANAPKMQHIKLVNSSGGMLNGSTSYDVTNYYEAVPSNALERVLWLEADRMRALKVDDENLKNQRDVVKEEVRVNVMNQPYGGFPWLDMPPVAFRNWANAHNFYGDFADLDAADLADVQAFFKTYYVPNNSILIVSGDFELEAAKAMVKKYFAWIPKGSPIELYRVRQAG